MGLVGWRRGRTRMGAVLGEAAWQRSTRDQQTRSPSGRRRDASMHNDMHARTRSASNARTPPPSPVSPPPQAALTALAALGQQHQGGEGLQPKLLGSKLALGVGLRGWRAGGRGAQRGWAGAGEQASSRGPGRSLKGQGSLRAAPSPRGASRRRYTSGWPTHLELGDGDVAARQVVRQLRIVGLHALRHVGTTARTAAGVGRASAGARTMGRARGPPAPRHPPPAGRGQAEPARRGAAGRTLQKRHQGAYSATSVSFSRGPSSSAARPALSSLATPPAAHRSDSSAACSSPLDAEMLPLCRPHSLAAVSSHHQRPSRSCGQARQAGQWSRRGAAVRCRGQRPTIGAGRRAACALSAKLSMQRCRQGARRACWLGSTGRVHGSQPMLT